MLSDRALWLFLDTHAHSHKVGSIMVDVRDVM